MIVVWGPGHHVIGIGSTEKHHAATPRSFVARHGFLRDVAILTGGSVAAQVLPIAFTPVLTRLYSPTDIGTLGLFTSFVNFAAGAATLGYSFAIVSANDQVEGARLTALSSLVVVPMALMETLGFFLLIRAHVLGFEQLPYWSLVAMVPALILTGIYTTLRYWMIRVDDYSGISRATVAQSVGRLVVQIGAGLAGATGGGLLVGEVAGRVAGLRQMATSTWGETRRLLTGTTTTDLRRVAVAYRKFPLFAAPSLLLNGIALALPVPLVAAYFGIVPAGQYAIAARVMILPMSLIGTSVSDVFHRRIAELSRTSPDRALGFLLRSFASLFALALAPATIVTIGGEGLFALVLGEEWRLAGALAVAVVPWVVMQFAVSPLSRLVQVYQGQESQLLYNVLHIANIALTMSYGHSQGWSLVGVCTVVAWMQAGIYAVYFLLLIHVVRKNGRINVPGETA